MSALRLAAALALALCSTWAGAASFDAQHRAWTALLTKHVVLIDGGRASRVSEKAGRFDFRLPIESSGLRR